MRFRWLALALVPAVASATSIDDPADPSLDGAATIDFDGVTDINASGFATTVGDVLVTVEVDASAFSVIECADPEANADCHLVSYQDPPVSAVGLTMSYSVVPFSATFEGDSGQEIVTDVTSGWQHPESVFVGATGVGPISTVALSAEDYATYWNDLTLATGSATAPADLKMALSPARSVVGDEANWPLDLTLNNAGPSAAAATRAMMLVPRGATSDNGTPTVSGAFYELGDIANGAAVQNQVPLTTPSRADFSCEDTDRRDRYRPARRRRSGSSRRPKGLRSATTPVPSPIPAIRIRLPSPRSCPGRSRRRSTP